MAASRSKARTLARFPGWNTDNTPHAVRRDTETGAANRTGPLIVEVPLGHTDKRRTATVNRGDTQASTASVRQDRRTTATTRDRSRNARNSNTVVRCNPDDDAANRHGSHTVMGPAGHDRTTAQMGNVNRHDKPSATAMERRQPQEPARRRLRRNAHVSMIVVSDNKEMDPVNRDRSPVAATEQPDGNTAVDIVNRDMSSIAATERPDTVCATVTERSRREDGKNSLSAAQTRRPRAKENHLKADINHSNSKHSNRRAVDSVRRSEAHTPAGRPSEDGRRHRRDKDPPSAADATTARAPRMQTPRGRTGTQTAQHRAPARPEDRMAMHPTAMRRERERAPAQSPKRAKLDRTTTVRRAREQRASANETERDTRWWQNQTRDFAIQCGLHCIYVLHAADHDADYEGRCQQALKTASDFEKTARPDQIFVAIQPPCIMSRGITQDVADVYTAQWGDASHHFGCDPETLSFIGHCLVRPGNERWIQTANPAMTTARMAQACARANMTWDASGDPRASVIGEGPACPDLSREILVAVRDLAATSAQSPLPRMVPVSAVHAHALAIAWGTPTKATPSRLPDGKTAEVQFQQKTRRLPHTVADRLSQITPQLLRILRGIMSDAPGCSMPSCDDATFSTCPEDSCRARLCYAHMHARPPSCHGEQATAPPISVSIDVNEAAAPTEKAAGRDQRADGVQPMITDATATPSTQKSAAVPSQMTRSECGPTPTAAKPRSRKKKTLTQEQQNLWDDRVELATLDATKEDEINMIIFKTTETLQEQTADLQCRRIAVDILCNAVKLQPGNNQIKMIITALLDLLRHGHAEAKIRNIAQCLWQRLITSPAERTSLLFGETLAKYVVTNGKDALSGAEVTIDKWHAQSAQHAAPYAEVAWKPFLAQLEKHRHKPNIPGALPTALQPRTVTWRSATDIKVSEQRSTDHRYFVWNGNSFRRRFAAGEITKALVELQPAVFAFLETKTDVAHLENPWATKEFFFAMGYSLVCWHSSERNHNDHGVMVAIRADVADEATIHIGLDSATVDDDGRAITVEFKDHAAVITYAPCTKWGKVERDKSSMNRRIFQLALESHVEKWQAKKPTLVLGDLNVAPTHMDSTYRPLALAGAKHYDIADNGARIMATDTISSCKPYEREWHAELLEKTRLVDASYPEPGGTLQRRLTWAKTPELWNNGNGMRIDFTLAPLDLMDKEQYPHIVGAEPESVRRGSDHAGMITDLRRAPPPSTAAEGATTARDSETAEKGEGGPCIIATAGDAVYCKDVAKRTIAQRTLHRKLGDFMPTIPRLGESYKVADDIFIMLVQQLAHIDSSMEEEDLNAPPAAPTPNVHQQNGDEAQAQREEDMEQDEEDAHDDAIVASITAHSAHQGGRGQARSTRIYAEVSIHDQATGQETTALLDTGAACSLISASAAHRFNLQADASGPSMSFKMADGSTSASLGLVIPNMRIGGHGFAIPLHTLPKCPYPIILGNDFLEDIGSILDYRNKEWRFIPYARDGEDPHEEITVKFKPVRRSAAACLVHMDADFTVPSHSTMQVPVRIDTAGANNMNNGTTFGFFDGAPSGKFVVCKGVGEIAAAGMHNFVTLTNTTKKPLKLAKNLVVATFTRDDLEAYETYDDKATSDDERLLATRREQIKAMSDDALVQALQESPHLKTLDLTGAAAMFSSPGLRRMREMSLLHQRLWDESEKPPPPSGAKCTIRLTKEPTLNGTMPHVNPNVRTELAQIINDKLQRGIIERGHGPYTSTVLLLPKPKGGVRFVLDYRALNECVRSDAYTLPQVDEVLSALGGSKFFSTLDIKEAFWSVPLDEDSKQLTAFRTPLGLFQYTRMPMGLKTASAVFCRFLDGIVGDLRWTTALTYIDDVLIYTESEEQHLDALETLLERLDAANLTLKASKTVIAVPSVEFLGHVVDRSGTRPSTAKIKAIEAIKLPNNPAELRTALGLFGYYRRFISGYAKLTHPLREKLNIPRWDLGDDAKPIWTQAERDAFFAVRDRLQQSPALAHPDWSKPFQLHTDASREGLGAMLTQKQDGKDVAIAYASRAIAKPEQAFAVWELEALAVVWACRLFRMYLYCSHFKIITDSQAVTTILKATYKAAGGRLARWSLALQDFDYELIHRSGRLNLVPDGLSRNPIDSTQPYNEGPTDLDPPAILVTAPADDTAADKAPQILMPDGTSWDMEDPFEGRAAFYDGGDKTASSEQDWMAEQTADPSCRKIIERLNSNTAINAFYKIDSRGILTHTTTQGRRIDIEDDVAKEKNVRWTTVVPKSLRAFVMYRYHALPVSGHHGRDNTQRNIKRSYYWDGMDKDIARWVKACVACQRRKQPRHLNVGRASSVSTAQRPWEKVAIDIVSASTTHADGKRYILTVLDLFTRWAIAIPLKSKKAEEVANAIFNNILCIHGRPDTIVTDEGSEFVNAGLRFLYKRWGIQPITTGGYQPQALPVERFHRFLNGSMTTLAAKFGEDWTTYLPAVVFAYNSSVTVSTGYSPYALLFGRNPRFIEDTAIVHGSVVNDFKDEPDFAKAIARRLHRAYDHVRAQQERMASQNRARRQLNHRDVTYEVGDHVLYWEPQQRRLLHTAPEADDEAIAHRGPSKWTPKWTGPHLIVAKTQRAKARNPRYTIHHVERGVEIEAHPNKLCAYQPWSDNTPSTSWELDTTRPYTTGAWVREGSLVIVPLQQPYPFGVGRVISASSDGALDIRWLGANSDNTTPHTSKLYQGWKFAQRGRRKQSEDLTIYYQDTARNRAHQPYRVADDADVPFTQEDVVLHSFELTESRRLPAVVTRALSKHPAIWWTDPRKQDS